MFNGVTRHVWGVFLNGDQGSIPFLAKKLISFSPLCKTARGSPRSKMARFPPVILAQEILGAQCNDEAVHPPTYESWCSKWNTLSLYKYSRPAATHAVSDSSVIWVR